MPDYDMINIAATYDFNPISNIARIPPAPEAYREIRRSVHGQIRLLRRFLATLGEADQDTYGHRAGHRADMARLARMAVIPDPSVLIGQESRPAPDLFLGIVVDCSGSMAFEERIDRAKSFGVLLLESARHLRGIDAYANAFTDHTIFDLGRPGDTRIARLEPNGGNNDAAGLLHAAKYALKSRKRHKILVMISDGYPTECSFDSLAKLVQFLQLRY